VGQKKWVKVSLSFSIFIPSISLSKTLYISLQNQTGQ